MIGFLKNSKNLHHAYAVSPTAFAAIIEFFEKEFSFQREGNPDFYHIQVESFGIEESRRVKEINATRSFNISEETAGKKLVIIESSSFTPEAQNALLKVFEEPQEGIHIFVLTASPALLLPTLRSRMQVIHAEGSHGERGDRVEHGEAKKFLKSSIKDRIEYADGLAADVSDEKKTRADIMQFLDGLEQAISLTDSVVGVKRMQALLKARDYMQDRSPSMKQLLEYVALSV